MCCFCCPSTITALFCLWVQSGCSKGTVAGALTFFPPEPALYQFERRDKHGRVLAMDEEVKDDDHNDEDDSDDDVDDSEDDDRVMIEHKKDVAGKRTRKQRKKKKRKSRPTMNHREGAGDITSNESPEHEDDCSIGEIVGPAREEPLEAETKGQTQEQMKSPMQQLLEQSQVRRKLAAQRNIRDANDAKHGVTYKLLLDPRLQVPPHDDGAISAVKIAAPRGIHVATVIYKVPANRRTQYTKTIIYSHGNATDIGAMFPIQVVLAHSLDCNVVVYDYSGYGESGGVPDVNSTYRDIDAVFDYVLDEVADGNPGNVVLYGQSVGSGPCCYLSAKNSEVGGMILHSPFTSGMRVLTPSRLLACLDIYPNIDRIKKSKCPVMVIHGQLDQEVDISHGIDLYNAVKPSLRREPWWVPNRGHNDIIEGTGKLSEYIRRIRGFLISLDE